MEHFQIKWGQDYMAGVIFLLDGKRVNGSAKINYRHIPTFSVMFRRTWRDTCKVVEEWC